jgi:CRISPR system Cascade subunit CasC
MIVELHLIQSFPVSNLNRDDVGQPKTAVFGGQLRGRISSQSLKRAARQEFTKHGLAEAETGVRTKRLLRSTVNLLVEQGRPEEEAVAVTGAALRALGFGFDRSRKELSQYLLFVGRRASTLLAEFCDREWDKLAAQAAKDAASERKKKTDDDDEEKPGAKKKNDKVKPDKATLEEARRILDASRVADIALFGRMIADNKDFSVDAASQVAHALSTHAVVNEYDYYTAVDDLKPDAEAGADMIGTVDFNTACYYRYANLHLEQLAKNLDGDTDLVRRSTEAWLNAFIDAVPGGKQNSTAARTAPETLLVVVRESGAWNLANAFLKPIAESDLMGASTRELVNHFERLRRFYGSKQITNVVGAAISSELALPAEEIAATREELVSRAMASAKV